MDSLVTICLIDYKEYSPMTYLISYFTGASLIIISLVAAMFNSSILPTENILLAKFTPEKHHGLIYGIKFIVAFGSAPIAVFLISKIYEQTNEFTNLFYISSILMILVTISVLFLPVRKNGTIIVN